IPIEASSHYMLNWMKKRITCRSEEHTSELQSLAYLVCRLLLEKKKKIRGMQPVRQIITPVESAQIRYVQRVSPRSASFVSLYCNALASVVLFFFFFFNDTATTEIYTLSLHDALPI